MLVKLMSASSSAEGCRKPGSRLPITPGGGIIAFVISSVHIQHPRRYKAMAYKITEECIACGACEAECPTNSITEGDEFYQINWETCVECVDYFDEPQCLAVCPVEAPVAAPDHPRA
jgi:ferredoxin